MISYSYWLDRLTGVKYKMTWFTDRVTRLRQCINMTAVR